MPAAAGMLTTARTLNTQSTTTKAGTSLTAETNGTAAGLGLKKHKRQQ
jgi:hypothetical protein